MLPTDRFMGLVAAGLIPILAAAGNPAMLWLALGYDCVLLVLLVVDAVAFVPKRTELECRREVHAALPLHRSAEVTIQIENRSNKNLVVRFRDLIPPACQSHGNRGEIQAPARTRMRPKYSIVPLSRGVQEWGPLTLRYRSGLGLLWRQWKSDESQQIKVHPDPKPRTRDEALAMRMSRQGPSGMRITLTRGEGREFESLREYRPDDEFRRIDWKATARRGSFIVREYEAERDQRVMILLDCGRSMLVRQGDLSRADIVAEAALRLARVAVESGDRVGIVAFSGSVKSAVAPGKGQSQLRRLAEELTHLEADEGEPDYEAAFSRLRSLVGRRSLVVVLTEVHGEQAGRVLHRMVRSAAPRHLPVILSVRDPELVELSKKEPVSVRDPWPIAVAKKMREEQAAIYRLLRTSGAMAVEVDPGDLSFEAVTRYLDVKAKGIL